MTLGWIEHPEARDEFLEAHERYSAIDDGKLGNEFADAVESAIELILQWPEASAPYLGRNRQPVIRTWHLGKFPYQVIYAVLGEDVLVLAYAHDARRPGYWSRRLDD